MKRVFTCVGGLLLSFAFVSTASAGAIDNKTNWSAEYIRTLNRNAATDYADIAAYNPAGTVKLQDGFIINGSVQFLSKEYKNIIDGISYESDEPSVIPTLFGVYNRDKWAIFGAMTVVAGGGKVDFNQGNWRTMEASAFLGGLGTYVSSNLQGESHYLGYTLGTAFEVNDMFSFSVGIRYVDAYKELQGTVDAAGDAALYFEQEDDGWGGIFGINVAPNDKLNIGMRYETKTKLDLEASIPTPTNVAEATGVALLNGQGIFNGQSNARDLPAIFAFGVSYWLNPKLRLETNYTHYFNQDADWDGEENLVDDGYDVGIALEYHFNDSLLASIGYIHTKLGVNPQDMLPENPELDANTIGAGIAYAINEKFHTNISIGNSFYGDDSFTSLLGPAVEYEKNVFFVAVGMEYRF